jgi:hypothetical protein
MQTLPGYRLLALGRGGGGGGGAFAAATSRVTFGAKGKNICLPLVADSTRVPAT